MAHLEKSSSKDQQKLEKQQAEEYRRIGKMVYESSGWGSSSLAGSMGWTFVRGLIFGLGTFFGGTIVAALLLWIFAQVGEVPFLGELIRSMQESYESTR